MLFDEHHADEAHDGFVWGYALAWFLVSDRVKLVAYRILDSSEPEGALEQQGRPPSVCLPRHGGSQVLCRLDRSSSKAAVDGLAGEAHGYEAAQHDQLERRAAAHLDQDRDESAHAAGQP